MSPDQSQRTRRRWRYGSNTLLQILLLAWILISINVWAFYHSWRIDMTSDQRYEASGELLEIIKQLQEPVTVVIPHIGSPSGEGRITARIMDRAIRLCQELEVINPLFRVESVVHIGQDPQRWAQVREEYEIDQENHVYLLLDGGKYREAVSVRDMAIMSQPTETDPRSQWVLHAERVSDALAAGLQRLLAKEAPRIVFSQGNGEVPLAGGGRYSVAQFTTSLRQRGFRVDRWSHSEQGMIPDDTALLVVVAGGDRGFDPFSGDAREAIRDYLGEGGALLLLLPFEGRCGLEPALRDRGVVGVESGIVVQEGPRGPSPQLLVEYFRGDHPITRGLDAEGVWAEVPLCRGLRVQDPAVALLHSSNTSWVTTDLTRYLPNPGEERASHPLFAAYDPAPDAPAALAGRVVVSGSWALASDFGFKGTARQLLLNSVYWLAGRDTLTAAPGKEVFVHAVKLDEKRRRVFFWIAMIAFPALALLAGFTVYGWRKR